MTRKRLIKRRSGLGTRKINPLALLERHGKIGKSIRRKKKEAKSKRRLNGTFCVFTGISIFVILGGLLGTFNTLHHIEESLPEPGMLINRKANETTIIYDRNGAELYKIFTEENRIWRDVDDYRNYTKAALLAAEDMEFYNHTGFDFNGTVSCAYMSLRHFMSEGEGGQLCGGSTITQQLVRRTLMYDTFGEEAFARDILRNSGKVYNQFTSLDEFEII